MAVSANDLRTASATVTQTLDDYIAQSSVLDTALAQFSRDQVARHLQALDVLAIKRSRCADAIKKYQELLAGSDLVNVSPGTGNPT